MRRSAPFFKNARFHCQHPLPVFLLVRAESRVSGGSSSFFGGDMNTLLLRWENGDVLGDGDGGFELCTAQRAAADESENQGGTEPGDEQTVQRQPASWTA